MGGLLSSRRYQKGSRPNKSGVVVKTCDSEVNLLLVAPDSSEKMSSDKKFETDVVEAHNKLRKNHQAKSLVQKKELSKHAQKWADHIASKGILQHSKDSNYGENIAMTSKTNPTGI